MATYIGENINSLHAVEKDENDTTKLYTRLMKEIKLSRELDEVIEHTTDGIVITDGNGKTLRVNKAYEIIAGIKREDLLNKPISLLVANKIVSVSSTLVAIGKKTSVTMEQTIIHTGKKVLMKNTRI